MYFRTLVIKYVNVIIDIYFYRSKNTPKFWCLVIGKIPYIGLKIPGKWSSDIGTGQKESNMQKRITVTSA